MMLGYYMQELKKHLEAKETKQLWRQYCEENNIPHTNKITGHHKREFAKYITNILDVRAKEAYTRDNPVNESEETK